MVEYCKIHNEPKNIITDQKLRECLKCYLERQAKKQMTLFDKIKKKRGVYGYY